MFYKRLLVITLIFCICNMSVCFAFDSNTDTFYDFSDEAQQAFTRKENIVTIPEKVPINLRLNSKLSSDSVNSSEKVTVQLSKDWNYKRKLIVPEGSIVIGQIYIVKKPDNFEQDGKIGINFYEIQRPDGSTIVIKTKPLEFKVARNRWKNVLSSFGAILMSTPMIIATGGIGAIYLASMLCTGSLVEMSGRKGQNVEIASGTEFRIQTSETFEVDAYQYN